MLIALYCNYFIQASNLFSYLSRKSFFKLGCLFMLGVFTRITFILYILPVGVMILWSSITSDKGMLDAFTYRIKPIIVGMVMTAAFCLLVDNIYFGVIVFKRDKKLINLGRILWDLIVKLEIRMDWNIEMKVGCSMILLCKYF